MASEDGREGEEGRDTQDGPPWTHMVMVRTGCDSHLYIKAPEGLWCQLKVWGLQKDNLIGRRRS